jgi:hypothetical protein
MPSIGLYDTIAGEIHDCSCCIGILRRWEALEASSYSGMTSIALTRVIYVRCEVDLYFALRRGFSMLAWIRPRGECQVPTSIDTLQVYDLRLRGPGLRSQPVPQEGRNHEPHHSHLDRSIHAGYLGPGLGANSVGEIAEAS